MAGNSVNQQLAGEVDVVTVLMAGLRRTCDEQTMVMKTACLAVEHFVKGHRVNQELARIGGAIETLIGILRQQSGNAPLQDSALGALRHMVLENQSNTSV